MGVITIGNNGQLVIQSGVMEVGAIVSTEWNPLDKTAGITLSNNNLTAAAPDDSTFNAVRTVQIGMDNTTKYYWEITRDAGDSDPQDWWIGVKQGSDLLTPNIFNGETILQRGSGQLFDVGGASALGSGAAVTNGDVAMWALDVANGRAWCGVNGTWYFSGDPGANLNPSFINVVDTTYGIIFSTDNTAGAAQQCTANFGGAPFAYPVPSGFTGVPA